MAKVEVVRAIFQKGERESRHYSLHFDVFYVLSSNPKNIYPDIIPDNLLDIGDAEVGAPVLPLLLHSAAHVHNHAQDVA